MVVAVVVLAGVAVLASGGGSDDASIASGPVSSVGGAASTASTPTTAVAVTNGVTVPAAGGVGTSSTVAGARPGAGASADLDADEVDPCVLEPDEIRTLIAANPDAMGAFYLEGTMSPGVRDTWSCNYEWQPPDDRGPSVFSMAIRAAPRRNCLVEHRGICYLVGTLYGDAPTVTAPASIAQVVKDRIDAQ